MSRAPQSDQLRSSHHARTCHQRALWAQTEDALRHQGCVCVRACVCVCECVCECAQMCVWMVSVNVPEPEWPLRGQVDACASRCAHACLHVYLGRVHLRVEGGRGRE